MSTPLPKVGDRCSLSGCHRPRYTRTVCLNHYKDLADAGAFVGTGEGMPRQPFDALAEVARLRAHLTALEARLAQAGLLERYPQVRAWVHPKSTEDIVEDVATELALAQDGDKGHRLITVRLLAEGRTRDEMARALGISVEAVRSRMTGYYHHFGVPNAHALVALYWAKGWLDDTLVLKPRPGWDPRLARVLSERERSIVRLCARGLTHKEVATGLGISELTVKAHMRRIMDATGTPNVVALVSWGWLHAVVGRDHVAHSRVSAAG